MQVKEKIELTDAQAIEFIKSWKATERYDRNSVLVAEGQAFRLGYFLFFEKNTQLWKYAEIVPGAPATNWVGTDSYATEIVDVVRFKSGSRAGQIRYITVTSWDDRKFHPYFYEYNGREDLTLATATNERYNFLVIGEANSFQDPHF